MSSSQRSRRGGSPVNEDNDENNLLFIKASLVKIQTSIDEHKKDVIKKFEAQSKSIKKLKTAINEKIETEIKSSQTYIDQQVGLITNRINDIEVRVKVLETKENERAMYNYDDTLVAINLPYEPNEDIKAKAEALISTGLKVAGVPVLRATRLKSRDSKPGLTKIQVNSLEDKKKLLRAKVNLRHSQTYSKVYLRSSKSHEERQAEINFRTMLNVIPGGANYMLTGNGRIVKKTNNDKQKPQQGSGLQGASSGLQGASSGLQGASSGLQGASSSPDPRSPTLSPLASGFAGRGSSFTFSSRGCGYPPGLGTHSPEIY